MARRGHKSPVAPPGLPAWALTALLGVPLAVASGLAGRFAAALRVDVFSALLSRFSGLAEHYSLLQFPAVGWGLVAVGTATATVGTLAALVVPVRRRFSLQLMRVAILHVHGLLGAYILAVMWFTGIFEGLGIPLHAGGEEVTTYEIFMLRWSLLWPVLLAALTAAILHLNLWRQPVITAYTGVIPASPAAGDRLIENLRLHGREPRYRKSSLLSVWLHLFVIVILPWLLTLIGCIDPYRPPYGGGEPQVQIMQVVQPEKQKEQVLILRPDAAIVFHQPDLDDSEVMEQVVEITMHRYEADASAAFGTLGDGDASTPGWADGFKDGIVRFIRLEYNVRGWDDGMDPVSASDINFLRRFRELSGGMRTAEASESHPIPLLRRYPRDQAPPFVFMTGETHFTLSRREIDVLREFLLNGSLLFADASSPQWDRSFRQLASQLFPGNPLRVIADDDPIFQIPFTFRHGAPPLWHHGGRRALGVRHQNRWVIFYHPGDLHDAWKTGHQGLDRNLAESAYQLGINVVYYAFMRYFEATRELRR